MTRGGFRFMLVFCALMTISPITLIAFHATDPWGLTQSLSAATLVLCMALLGYLLYVRRHDAHFWDEEDARRADFDRRGRLL